MSNIHRSLMLGCVFMTASNLSLAGNNPCSIQNHPANELYMIVEGAITSTSKDKLGGVRCDDKQVNKGCFKIVDGKHVRLLLEKGKSAVSLSGEAGGGHSGNLHIQLTMCKNGQIAPDPKKTLYACVSSGPSRYNPEGKSEYKPWGGVFKLPSEDYLGPTMTRTYSFQGVLEKEQLKDDGCYRLQQSQTTNNTAPGSAPVEVEDYI